MPARGRRHRAPRTAPADRLRVERLADRTVPSGNPTALDDTYSTSPGAALAIAPGGVLANDTDPDGFALSAVLTQAPANGTLTLNADGSFAYAPSPGFTGTDEFRYRASSPNGESNNAHVFILVGVTNVLPVATDDRYVTAEDQPLM